MVLHESLVEGAVKLLQPPILCNVKRVGGRLEAAFRPLYARASLNVTFPICLFLFLQLPPNFHIHTATAPPCLHIQGLAPIIKNYIPTILAPPTYPISMAATQSDQNTSNQVAPPLQDETDQSPTPRVDDTEQAKQPMEQEVSIAIMRPWDSTITLTAQEKANFEESARLARYQPLPDPKDADLPDGPLTKPYDPETSTYDWAKPEAWIQDTDSEGNGFKPR